MVKLSLGYSDGFDPACANQTSAAIGQNTGSLRATLAATAGTDGGGRRSALETPKSSGVLSTFGMSDEFH